MLSHILIFALSFVGIWVGAGVTIAAVERLSKNIKISSFAVSFLILGAFTSISEFSVGVNSVIDNDPEIFVGNLIGASIVIFLLIIPLLAIVSKQVKINSQLQGSNLILSLLVIAAPVMLSLDGKVDRLDALISLLLFGLLVLMIETKKGLFERATTFMNFTKVENEKELLRIVMGVVVIFVSSHFVVEETLAISQLIGLSPFLISLLFISIGTNLPELSFVFRSVLIRDSQVAFGDYVGSASFNTFLFGILTLWYGKSITLTNSYLVSLGFLIVGLTMFYLFAKSRNTVSRLEGVILLTIYILFLGSEYVLHSNLLSLFAR